MSSVSSTVTYTSVYTDSEPGRVILGSRRGAIRWRFSVSHHPIYPEYIPLEDEHILPAEEQPLPPVVSPTIESPGYVAESNLEKDPEYEDDETEDGLVDYPMDEGDDDDGDSSGDDADDEDEDEEEDEEHLALADSAVVIPTDELVSPPEGTELVMLPPFTDTATTGARITVRLQAAISFPPEAEVERLLAMPTLSPSPLASLSSPSAGEHLARCTAPAALPSPPLPPPLHMPSPVDSSDDIPETNIPPRKRLCLSTQAQDAKASRRGIREVGYGIRDAWIDPTEAVPEIAPTTTREVNTRVTELVELHEHDTQDLYALLDDAQDIMTRISQRVAVDSQRVDLLMEDRIAHQVTIQIVEDEAYDAQEAWAHLIGLSQAVHSELQTHQEQMQQTKIAELRETERSHQEKIAETLRPRKAGQPRGDARVPNHQDAPRDTNKILGPDAYSMTWEILKKKMTDKYCPQGKIKKLEIELWNLKYINGIPDNTYGIIKASNPKTLDETIELANDLMDQKLRTYAERQSNNKRKADDSFINNHGHQQQTPKRQNVTKVYNIGKGERKPCNENLPKCTKCHFHHNGLCTQKCHKCNKVGHFARNCRSSGNANVANAQRNNGENPKGNAGNAEKRGNSSRDLDSKVVTGTFLLNNRYASILFDTDVNRSFISIAFSSMIDIVPTPLGNSYDVKLADGKIVGVDTIIRGCTLNFLGHPFNIDFMPVEMGSFDVIIVISCSKDQEYMAKGCRIFLAQISAKKEEDMSKGKLLEDVPVIRDYPEVFPKDLPGLPPARPAEFQIDLIPRAASVARASYRLAPSEMKELSKQLQEISKKAS
nr:hypothetical protein [Tanacetum cinerariifolium]